MNYYDGTKVEIGDKVELSKSLGIVVAIISENTYLEGYDSFAYLHKGVMIDFQDYGLIYYDDEIEEDVEFVKRK